MFAEEVKGNAAKKRQEEARARRRQLKQQQEKKKATEQSTTSAIPLSASDSSPVTVTSPSTQVPSSSVSSALLSETVPTGKAAVLENAKQQRQLRHQAQLHTKSAIKIQSLLRACRSNALLRLQETELLQSRLKDLVTLSTLIKTKTNKDYICPPATATILVRQVLFLTRTVPYFGRTPRVVLRHQDVSMAVQVLKHVLLVGVASPDENMNPLVPWPPERLAEVLRLSLSLLVHPRMDANNLKVVQDFMETVVHKTPKAIAKEVRHYLLPVTPLEFAESTITADKPRGNKGAGRSPYSHEQCGATLDVLQILRAHLLFGKGDPIPKEATTMRESCYTTTERSQTDVLFRLVVDFVQTSPKEDQWRLYCRFVCEILSLPLLTWKTTAKATCKLLEGSSPKPLLVEMIACVTENHAAALNAGKLGTLLPATKVSFTACPATPVQCLLANLVQLAQSCALLNGSVHTNYQYSALFYNFLAVLVDAVPLGTLATARESAVEWISDGKSHLTAVVLSPVVLEQCKYLLLESFVRDLFHCAIDDKWLETNRVLSEKTEKDLKQEKDLTSTTTAAGLAAKEARIDRSRGFWNSSNWAKGVKKGMGKIFVPGEGGKPKASASGPLQNVSASSKIIAEGSKKKSETNTARKYIAPFDSCMYYALCRVYGIVLARWGGGGRDDIVRKPSSLDGNRSNGSKEVATSAQDPSTLSILNVLSFSTSIVRATWAQTQSNASITKSIYAIIDESKGSTPIRLLNARTQWGSENDHGPMQLLIYLHVLTHTLIITDDVELYDMDKPIPLHQIRRSIQVMKKLLYRACAVDVGVASDLPSEYMGLSLIAATAKTMRDLYDRSSRRPLCLPKLWIIDDLMDKEIRRCKTFSDYESLLSTPVFRICPFLVSFKRRLKLFERIVNTNRIDIQGQHNSNPFASDSGLKPGIPVRIMRGRVLEDGLATMNKLGKNMRKRIIVHYLNEAGATEAGVDVGGLFKEFWTDLCAIAFDPNYALFRVTEGGQNCMYPNPASGAAHGSDHVILFEFLGRILGKALYEGITINPTFAHFFLSFLRGDYNFLHMLPDLSTMDAQLYNNLMFLKNYDGDAEDLCLTFTVANDDFGGNNETPLIPGGGNIAVTNRNKQRYIGLVAKYHVCDRLREQSQAFTRGLWDVIERPWLRLFNEPELQVLISGPTDGGVDVDDMRANVRYAGGFSGIDRTVNRFWSIMSSFSSEHQRALLRFVTSCERPPPLGFASMNPPFTLQRVGILRDGDKLPTASTCFNTLKLPTYSSEKVLRNRLIYAIESGAGFELT